MPAPIQPFEVYTTSSTQIVAQAPRFVFAPGRTWYMIVTLLQRNADGTPGAPVDLTGSSVYGTVYTLTNLSGVPLTTENDGVSVAQPTTGQIALLLTEQQTTQFVIDPVQPRYSQRAYATRLAIDLRDSAGHLNLAAVIPIAIVDPRFVDPDVYATMQTAMVATGGTQGLPGAVDPSTPLSSAQIAQVQGAGFSAAQSTLISDMIARAVSDALATYIPPANAPGSQGFVARTTGASLDAARGAARAGAAAVARDVSKDLAAGATSQGATSVGVSVDTAGGAAKAQGGGTATNQSQDTAAGGTAASTPAVGTDASGDTASGQSAATGGGRATDRSVDAATGQVPGAIGAGGTATDTSMNAAGGSASAPADLATAQEVSVDQASGTGRSATNVTELSSSQDVGAGGGQATGAGTNTDKSSNAATAATRANYYVTQSIPLAA